MKFSYLNKFLPKPVHRNLLKQYTHRLSSSKATTEKTYLKDISKLRSSYDVIIIGAGHNGLVSAAYLQKAGYSVCVLEKRHVIGGAAVTEEIVPGFKFSRASYVLSLLRPFIINDLKLKEHGLKFYMREPYSSYTPISEKLWSRYPAKSLLLSSTDINLTKAEIAKFSTRDASVYEKYEEQVSRFVKAIVHLLDNRPPNLSSEAGGSWKSLIPLMKAVKELRLRDLPEFHEIMTASAAKILDRWFESEPLKATLATDATIGSMAGPYSPGTGYVLLHHVMGGTDTKPGAWAYVEGGMGTVSQAIGASAAQSGASIFTEQEIQEIIYEKESNGKVQAKGVLTKDGKQITANLAVFSNATPHVTFTKLTNTRYGKEYLGEDFIKSISSIDYTSPVTKINVAVSRLPNFVADPNAASNTVQNHHKCTIHLNCESNETLEKAFQDCQKLKHPSERPLIELVIPSSLDPTLAPEGAHVCLLFTQYTPYSPANGSWEDEKFKEKYAQTVFNVVEEYAPGFKESIIGKDILTPVDLEKTFGLTGGNIFHGAMSMDQLYWLRPVFTKSCWFPQTPVKGLYLCGSGVHPGGGVMGLPGYLAAKAFLESSK